ncbi:ATP-NAD kinase-like domain-containing protein [Zopfochytrium polystomum]|nr:ATP-NAD kinase-like domain-containing protein [Zopfochytrium polystomum]
MGHFVKVMRAQTCTRATLQPPSATTRFVLHHHATAKYAHTLLMRTAAAPLASLIFPPPVSPGPPMKGIRPIARQNGPLRHCITTASRHPWASQRRGMSSMSAGSFKTDRAGPASESVKLLSALSRLAATPISFNGISTVLIVTRPHPEVIELSAELASYLWLEKKVNVLVGQELQGAPGIPEHLEYGGGMLSRKKERLAETSGEIAYWDNQLCTTFANEIDLVVTVGGDGTVLYSTHLFQNCHPPPIVPFYMGSLGFLTVFEFDSYQSVLDDILRGVPHNINLRNRLEASVFSKSIPPEKPLGNDDMIVPSFTTHILNDLVVDRGANPTVLALELYVGDAHAADVLADGVVVGTPTGMRGGSLVHPDKASMLVTPICPHSLTARPMVLPGGLELHVRVSDETRSMAWVSLDGRSRVQLDAGDFVVVKSSPYPVMTVCREDSSRDWFRSLVESLGWNTRKRQKPVHDIASSAT